LNVTSQAHNIVVQMLVVGAVAVSQHGTVGDECVSQRHVVARELLQRRKFVIVRAQILAQCDDIIILF
jgi:hypothetical protein